MNILADALFVTVRAALALLLALGLVALAAYAAADRIGRLVNRRA